MNFEIYDQWNMVLIIAGPNICFFLNCFNVLLFYYVAYQFKFRN